MEEKEPMTVSEAGRRGGKATAAKHGSEFYERIGRMGGQRVRQLIEAGKQAVKEEEEDGEPLPEVR